MSRRAMTRGAALAKWGRGKGLAEEAEQQRLGRLPETQRKESKR
jgi:hypothetical protein